MQSSDFDKVAKAWLKANQKVLRNFKGQWIAYNGEDGIIAYDQDATKVMKAGVASNKPHIIKYVHPYTYAGLRRIVPIRFRPLHLEVWEPNVTVGFHHDGAVTQLEMLVDSGADISTIPFKIGQEIGLILHDSEVKELAVGVNGTVEYVLRNLEITLENYRFKAPFAWLLNENCDDILLGREVVFDLFDIEFKQRDGEIIFKKHLEL